MMTIQVLIPKIGLTMTEARIVEWKKKEGERVEKGEILFVFETEKVAFEVEAAHSGILAGILAQVDEIVGVGEVVGLIAEEEGGQAESTGKKPEAIPEEKKNQAAEGKVVKLSGMRRIIAEKMLAGKRETAQAYMAVSVDAAKILESRERLAPIVEKAAGAHLTITDILMKICAVAISRHPVINTRWTSEGILWLNAIHMGMAMAIEEGLIVPVIRDIGSKTLSEIAGARAAIVEKGKAGKLTPDDLRGSTFTLSSLGMFGVEEFTAIINPPESAILAAGAILDKPVAVNKEVVVRPAMKLTLSYDHRVIDGAIAAGFMKTLKEMMEDPVVVVD